MKIFGAFVTLITYLVLAGFALIAIFANRAEFRRALMVRPLRPELAQVFKDSLARMTADLRSYRERHTA